jgi:trimethylamine-N-oxide reductase (cytochrome c)
VKEDKKKEKGEVSRRDFLVGAGAVVVGGAIGAGITYPLVSGKADGEVVTTTKTVSVPTTVTTTVGDGATATVTDTVTTTVGGDGATVTKTVTTTVGDGGAVPPALEPEWSSIVHASPGHAIYDMKNGKIIRGRKIHYQYGETDPITFEARGKTLTFPPESYPSPAQFLYRKRTDSPCKILYPLKRVDWEPGGDPAKINPQNRGFSKFRRISWEEAANIIVSEVERIAGTYGPEAVCVNRFSMGENKNVVGNKSTHKPFLDYWLLTKFGGLPTDTVSDTASFVGGAWGGIHFSGVMLGKDDGYEEGDLFRDIADHTELFYVMPGDTTSMLFGKNDGLLSAMCMDFLKFQLEIKMVWIDSKLNRGAGVHADKWIPILPGTDAAMHAAIAYTWITEDTYDKDYQDTHTVGFDKWKAYVLGDEDGIPKTPEWAAAICNVPEWTIKAVAREWASHITSAVMARQGGATCRAPYSTEPTRTRAYLLGMQGWGKPGQHLLRTGRVLYHSISAPRMSVSASSADLITTVLTDEIGAAEYAAAQDEQQQVNQRDLEKAILDPPISWYRRRPQHIEFEYPLPGKSEMRMIWHGGGSSYHGGCSGGTGKFNAFRSPKIEFSMCNAQFMEEPPLYCDIILPVRTQLENNDIKVTNDVYRCLHLEKRCVEPRGEAKTDFGVVLELAKALGWYDKFTGGRTEEQIYEDQIKQGAERVDSYISWEDLVQNGHFVLAGVEKGEKDRTPMNDFYEDPSANPLATPTGKLEYESQYLLEHFPDDNERPPVAKYVTGGPPEEGWTHNEYHLGPRGNDFPLIMISNVPPWGEHSMHGDIPWTREISKQICWDGYAYEDLEVNPKTAAERGIKHGDIVEIFNERGSVLGAAYVTEEMTPGALHMTKGRQSDYISEKVNRAGSPNVICPNFVSRNVKTSTSFNGYLVQLRKVTGEQMDEWRENKPEAFERDYDPNYGPLFSGWLERPPADEALEWELGPDSWIEGGNK